jgi:hypothetical protein
MWRGACDVYKPDMLGEEPGTQNPELAMILLFAFVAWLLVLSLVAGLCAAAHTGDVTQIARPSRPSLLHGEGLAA